MDMPIGIKEIAKSDLNVYPNPFINEINIEVENLENANIRLYSYFGKLVFQTNRTINGSLKLAIPKNLALGNYYLQVIGKDKGFNYKLVKQ